MYVIMYYLMIAIGGILIIAGLSNMMRKPDLRQKTAWGKVESFDLIFEGKGILPKRYELVVNAGKKKYTLESVHMPWVNEGEQVLIQTTGEQRLLGSKRLTIQSRIELAIGLAITVVPIVLGYLYSYYVI